MAKRRKTSEPDPLPLSFSDRPRGFVATHGAHLRQRGSQTVLVERGGKGLALKPGGPWVWLGWMPYPLTGKTGMGHYDATKWALEAFLKPAGPLSNQNLESLAFASRLADFEHFEDVAYHAQSATDGAHRLANPQSPAEDLRRFRHTLRSQFRSAAAALEEGAAERYFYHVGYVLHLVEDLAVHQGMSNPEHRRLELDRRSPDDSPERFALAVKLARETFAEHLAGPLGASGVADKIAAAGPFTYEANLARVDRLKVGAAALAYLRNPLRTSLLGAPGYRARWLPHWSDDLSSLEAAFVEARSIVLAAVPRLESVKGSRTFGVAAVGGTRVAPSVPATTMESPAEAGPVPSPSTQSFLVVAQDPGVVGRDGRMLLETVELPAGTLRAGPHSYRLQVVDYDATTKTLYRAADPVPGRAAYLAKSDAELLADPEFHRQNVFALVQKTLSRFERALGRRVHWGPRGHQLYVAPHAFEDANAFYSPDLHALLFGYLRAPGRRGTIFTCLSHDVVVHETAHALLDGLRNRLTEPSSPDQAAFHEGFADLVALLSVFSMRSVVSSLVAPEARARGALRRLVRVADVTPERLSESVLFGMAEELGRTLGSPRATALRRSIELPQSPIHYTRDPAFLQPHRRGEILVAAMLHAFLDAWRERLRALGTVAEGCLDRERVVEEGSEAAECLLSMAIRALDYLPPVHVTFVDFLRAMLTADAQARPDDATYGYRKKLLRGFASYGVLVPPESLLRHGGRWAPPAAGLSYDDCHFEGLQRDPAEVFRFIWANQKALGVSPKAYGEVISVRPCVRVAPDGFVLRETVAEFVQTLPLLAGDLKDYGIERPEAMDPDQEVQLRGGGTLVFNEHGRLKYFVHNGLLNAPLQQERLRNLWRFGAFSGAGQRGRVFADMNQRRMLGSRAHPGEVW